MKNARGMSHVEWLAARQSMIDGGHAESIKRDDEDALAALRAKYPDLVNQQQHAEQTKQNDQHLLAGLQAKHRDLAAQQQPNEETE